MSEAIQIEGVDGEFSLADLAGLDTTEFKEVRFVLNPVGKYHWRIKEAKLDVIETKNDDGDTVRKPITRFELESQNCLALVDDELNPADYTAIKHNETFWLKVTSKKDFDDSVGMVKAFLLDIGSVANGRLEDVLAESCGHEFIADITHGKNKNNPDKPWVNLNRESLQTLEDYQLENSN